MSDRSRPDWRPCRHGGSDQGSLWASGTRFESPRRDQAGPARAWQPGLRLLHAGLDDAPLIVDFELQLEQRREVESMLRHIAAVVDFDLGCLGRGIDPRSLGAG